MYREPDNRRHYGSIMAMCLLPDFENTIKQLVLPSDLVDIEDKPHVTILYGIFGEYGPLAANVQIPNKYYDIQLELSNSVSAFCPEKGNDVLKLDVVQSDLLLEFRRYVQSQFVWTNVRFTEYKPHLTLAFIKGGTAEKYTGRIMPFPRNIKPWSIIYKYNGSNTII